MTTPKHSPLPFQTSRLGEADVWDDRLILDKGGGLVARVSDEVDADLIVKAVNHYRNLISIAYRVGNTKCSCPMVRNCIHNAAKTAWKKAEGIEE